MEDDPDAPPASPHTKELDSIEMRDTHVVEGGASGGDLFLPDADDDSEDEAALAVEALAHAEHLAMQSRQLQQDAALEYQQALEEMSEDDEEDDEEGVRISGDDTDPIVRTIPILATKTLTPYLHFFAFPARKGKDQFENATARESARIKRETGQIEVDLTVADTHSPHYNTDRGTLWTDQPLRTMSLGGQVRPLHHLQAWYNRGVLHVTPVDKFVQLRPKLGHIDQRDKEERESKRQDAMADKPGRAAKTVQISARSTDAAVADLATTSTLLRLVEEEAWTPLGWRAENESDSWHYAESLMTEKKQLCKSLTNEEQYLELLSTVRVDGREPKVNIVKIDG